MPNLFFSFSLWEYYHFISPRQTIKSHGGRLAASYCCNRRRPWGTVAETWWRHVHTRGDDLFCGSMLFSKMTTTKTEIVDTKTNLSPVPAVCLRDSAVTTRIASPAQAFFSQHPRGPGVTPVWPPWKRITVVMISATHNDTRYLASDAHWWRPMWQSAACPQPQPAETLEIYLQCGPVLWHLSYIWSVCWPLNHHLNSDMRITAIQIRLKVWTTDRPTDSTTDDTSIVQHRKWS